MTNSTALRGRRCIGVLIVGLLLVGFLFSGSAVAQEPNQLRLPNGEVFHETDRPVRQFRTMDLPSGKATLHRWEEETPRGELLSFYAFSDEEGLLRGRVRETTHIVRLRDVRFDPLRGDAPSPSGALGSRPDNRHFLVQFEAVPLPEQRALIERAGGDVQRFLTDHTFLVEMTPTVKQQVAGLPGVRWIGPYHPSYRLEAPLRDAIDGLSPELQEQRYSILLTKRGQARQRSIAQRISRLGGKVEMIDGGGDVRLEATLSQEVLAEVAHLNGVLFIDRWGGPGEVDMNIVRQVGGADAIESLEGWTGQGVRGEVFDTELRATHQEWPTAPIVHSPSTSCGGTPHGTSAYSDNFAQGVDPEARGMVPDAQGIFYCHGYSNQFGGSESRYTANAELIDPAGPYRAVYQTSSVGSARTLFYTTVSAEVDDYLFLHQLLSTQSQSNAGDQMSRPQAWSKNIVSVGGIRHRNTASRCDDYWGAGASIGPAEDGRIKPDLSFFYDSIRSASNSSNSSYTSFGGTSAATPETAGHFGIFYQMWHEGVWAGHGGAGDVFDSRPQMSTAKAMLINHAYRYEWTNPGGCDYSDVDRYKQGWGTADLQRLYDRAAVTQIIDESAVIAPLETHAYGVGVAAGQGELNVTMVFTDPAGSPSASQARINDLSLRVTSPSGTVYWGNNGLT